MNDKKLLKNDVDDDFPDGVYAVPRGTDEPGVKVQRLDGYREYCKKTGIELSELSNEEIELINHIIDMITFFEGRYRGTYEEVVAMKGDPFKTDDFDWQWAREGREWRSLLKEIGGLI